MLQHRSLVNSSTNDRYRYTTRAAKVNQVVGTKESTWKQSRLHIKILVGIMTRLWSSDNCYHSAQRISTHNLFKWFVHVLIIERFIAFLYNNSSLLMFFLSIDNRRDILCFTSHKKSEDGSHS